MTHETDVVCEPPAQRDYPPEPTTTRRAQDALVRHHQPQQHQQQHQPRQHNTQQQHAQTVPGSTIQLVPRKTDESSNASLMTGDEQWPTDDGGDATMQAPTPTPPPTTDGRATPTVPAKPAKNPDTTPTAHQRSPHMPTHFHPGKRRSGRRIITWFSGYDGFRESTIRRTVDWSVVGGTEDTTTEKGARIAALWEDNNPHGTILGHHREVQSKLLGGTLSLGEIDLHVITYPCWDHADCNEEGKGDAGDAGSFIEEAATLLDAITKHHKITGLLYEDVPSITQYDSFKRLLTALEEPHRGLASSWCIVDVWRLGSPTRRKRVVVIAAAHDQLRTGELELPMPGDERLPTDGLTMPTAADCLDAASSIPEEYRVATHEYEELPDDHFQYAWPSIQIGRLRNEPKNHYVYDPTRGPVATIRANMFKAEGPGRNTGLILDEIGPRRITPIECARIHGFATSKLSHLTPHQLYSIIGNSVTVDMAHAYLCYFDRVLK